MAQVKFPHILTNPRPAIKPNGDLARVVAPSVVVGEKFEFQVLYGSDTRRVWFEVVDIVTERPARGNWTNWPTQPNYYELKMQPIN